MAVLGDRGTGVLDMLIEGLRREGQNIATPNMSPVGATQLERTLNRPETRLGAYGTMTTQAPAAGSPIYQASQTPLMADMTRGRVLDVNDPMRQMPEPMPVQQVIQREQARRGAPAAPQQAADSMGMAKLAEDADRAVRMGAAETDDPSIVKTVQDYFGGRENMLRLAMAFNTMRLEPDAGLAAALGAELKDVRAQNILDSRTNATLKALRDAGVPQKDLDILAKDPAILREYAKKYFAKQMGTLPADQQAFENLIADFSPEDQEKARRIKAGLDPRAGSQFALTLEELFARSAAQAGGQQKGKSEQERAEAQIQNNKTWRIWEKAISGLEESLGNTPTGKIVGLLPAISSNQQIADQAIAIMAPVLKNIFRESGEGVFTDKDQQILIDMIPDRTSNPDTIAYAIKMINDIVAAKLNQQIQVEIVPTPQSNVLKFDAQGNPVQ